MGFSPGIFPLLAVLGVFKLRRVSRMVAEMPVYPAATALYLLFGTLLLVLAFLQRPLESCIALATGPVGVPIYFLVKRRGA